MNRMDEYRRDVTIDPEIVYVYVAYRFVNWLTWYCILFLADQTQIIIYQPQLLFFWHKLKLHSNPMRSQCIIIHYSYTLLVDCSLDYSFVQWTNAVYVSAINIFAYLERTGWWMRYQWVRAVFVCMLGYWGEMVQDFAHILIGLIFARNALEFIAKWQSLLLVLLSEKAEDALAVGECR